MIVIVELFVHREGFDNEILFSIILGSNECGDIDFKNISSFKDNFFSIFFIFILFYDKDLIITYINEKLIFLFLLTF